MMDIQPIRNEQDYECALAEVERLWGSEQGTPAGDKLDVLIVLVDDYENKHHAIALPDPIAAIQFRMDQMGLARQDLEPYLGGRGRVSEILNRKRGLSLDMIRKLHQGLGIPLESLIQKVAA